MKDPNLKGKKICVEDLEGGEIVNMTKNIMQNSHNFKFQTKINKIDIVI